MKYINIKTKNGIYEVCAEAKINSTNTVEFSFDENTPDLVKYCLQDPDLALINNHTILTRISNVSYIGLENPNNKSLIKQVK